MKVTIIVSRKDTISGLIRSEGCNIPELLLYKKRMGTIANKEKYK
jgi:hypothetical protein